MNETFRELKRRLAEVHDLRMAGRLLEWDQLVMMPPAGGEPRAEALATIERTAHEAFSNARIGAMLEELRPYEESLAQDTDEASLIRVARRDWEKASRVPAELAAEMTRVASAGMRSDTIKRGFTRAPHRALLRATGQVRDAGDFDKPFIAVCNSFVEIVPGHVHLQELGQRVKQAILMSAPELSRARGGPRCMTMPLARDPV